MVKKKSYQLIIPYFTSIKLDIMLKKVRICTDIHFVYDDKRPSRTYPYLKTIKLHYMKRKGLYSNLVYRYSIVLAIASSRIC